MKVLLVRPYPELRIARVLEEGFLHLEPLDLETVAAGVPPEDEVAILDLSVTPDPLPAFESYLRTHKPDLVGFTAYSSQAHTAKALAALARKCVPDSIIIVGGIHATIAPGDYADGDFDMVVRGEGATAIREILTRADNGQPLTFDDRCLSPRDPSFAEKADGPPPRYPRVEDVPAPRRDLVDRSKYFCVWTSSPTNRLKTMFPQVASVRSSVGCAFNCSFCVVPFMMHRKYIQREPEDVVTEIAGLDEEYVYFVDDEMFLNPKRVKRIAELLIERGIEKHYVSWARSDTIIKHPDLFELWHSAGLSTLYVGIEAMDNTQLESYNKKTDANINRRAVDVLKKIGITLHASFLVNPDFTVEMFRRLEKDILEICPAEVTFTVMSPPPGTSLWHQMKDQFICDPYRYYDCMHTLVKTTLPLRLFYAHFSRLTQLALRSNPLRVKRTRIPFRDLIRAIYVGTKYIFALRTIYRDYPQDEHCPDHS